ncbi:MAG: TonB-dependent receptor [Alphaproteobacteria bacterium]|nr:TonB-dependent receptor [Alphaproteobacteria bacterium]
MSNSVRTLPAFCALLMMSAAVPSVSRADETPAAPAQDKDHQPIEKVVVTASPLAKSNDKFSKVVDTISRDEGLKNGGASIGDALEKQPGVSGTGFTAGANRPVVRGFDATRVLLTENGVGSLDVAEIGPDHGTPIDIFSASRIEIVRGAATLRYGSQAIGGVINVINGRIPDRPIDGVTGEVDGIYGSNANEGAGGFQTTFGSEGFAVHADGFLRHASDYDTPDGKQVNSYAKTDGYSLGTAYSGEQGSFGGAYAHYDATYGIASDTTFIDMRQDKYLTRGIWNANAGLLQRVTVEAAYARYHHDEVDPATGDIESTFLNDEVDSRAEAIFGAIGPASAVALGLQVQHRDFSALGDAADYLSPSTAQGVAGYVFARFPFGPQWELEASARVEGARREGTPISGVPTSSDYAPFSASASLAWTPTDAATFQLTATSAARVPDLPELFAIGGHDGPQTYEIGDPGLGLERANSLEAAITYETGPFQLRAALWGALYDGFIFGQLTGNFCDDTGACQAFEDAGHPLKELFYVQQDARFWGAEAQGRYDLAKLGDYVFGVSAQVDYVRGTLSNGGNVPREMPLRYGPGLYLEDDRLSAAVRLFRVEKQDKVGLFELPTPAYTDLSADITYRVYDDGDHAFDLSLVGRNLTDQVERNASSFVHDVVEMPGRDIRVVGRVTY